MSPKLQQLCITKYIYKKTDILKKKTKLEHFTCDFSKLFNNLFLCFTLGDRANEKPVVGDRYTHPDVLAWANLMIITL